MLLPPWYSAFMVFFTIYASILWVCAEKCRAPCIKTITTARKARWLSVAPKVIASTLVLPNIGKSIFLCENHFSALSSSSLYGFLNPSPASRHLFLVALQAVRFSALRKILDGSGRGSTGTQSVLDLSLSSRWLALLKAS